MFIKTLLESDVADSDSESECSGKHNTKINSQREKAHTKQFYTGSSHNTEVFQSPCISKGFHYNHSGLQIAQGLFQETSICSSTTARYFYA